MDDALRRRLDAIVILLAVVVLLLALLLVAVGGGQFLVLGVILALVGSPVGYAILTESDEEVTTQPAGTADDT